MRVTATIISTDLVTNSLLSSFCPFLQTKHKHHVFSKLVIWQQEMFLVFVYSESRSTSKPWQMNSIDFYKGILLHVILVRIIVPCQKLPMISFVYKAKSVQK